VKLEVIHKGRRYWAHRVGRRVNFWSDHRWPFYHGHIDSFEDDEVREGFYMWLPFRADRGQK
jgi:hypothetical protein